MKEQVLSPRVKDTEETNLCSEMLRIACNLAERFSNGAEQQVVEFALILENERVQLMWQREDDDAGPQLLALQLEKRKAGK